MSVSIKRGSVWRIDFDPVKRKEQAGFRYGVVSKKRLKVLSGSLSVEVTAKVRLVFKQMLVED